jgi:hypothetical protein
MRGFVESRAAIGSSPDHVRADQGRPARADQGRTSGATWHACLHTVYRTGKQAAEPLRLAAVTWHAGLYRTGKQARPQSPPGMRLRRKSARCQSGLLVRAGKQAIESLIDKAPCCLRDVSTALARTHTHARTHARTRTHARARTRTHTHTHIVAGGASTRSQPRDGANRWRRSTRVYLGLDPGSQGDSDVSDSDMRRLGYVRLGHIRFGRVRLGHVRLGHEETRTCQTRTCKTRT